MKKYLLIAALSLSAACTKHLTFEERMNKPETPEEIASRLEFTALIERQEREYDPLHANCTGRGCLIKGQNCIARDHARAQIELDSHSSDHFE
jgi:hypothetical protein